MQFFTLSAVADAREKWLQAAPQKPPVVEELPLSPTLLGRVSGQAITSPSTLPGFDRTTVDGYAVRAADTFGAGESQPAYLKLVGEVLMGQAAPGPLGPGQAIRISTGGMVPVGADAIVMVEVTEQIADDEISVSKPVSPKDNITRGDEDCRPGDVLISAGVRLRPQELGVLAAAGVTVVPVARRPRVAIISTGDELVEPHETPGPGQIRESNSVTLAACVLEAGGEPVYLGKAVDRPEVIAARLAEARAYDVVLISGGSSVGVRDLSADLIAALGTPGILVHGVSLKPGKPTILAIADGQPVAGLPGNPVSAQVVFGLFVAPMLRLLMGQAPLPAHTATVTARLSKNVPSAVGRLDSVRVTLYERDGDLWADPVYGKSGLITTMTKANGVVYVPPTVEGYTMGTPVPVELI